MALDKQNIPINLGQGVDTKTDPKHVLPGKLLRLVNGRFRKRNRIEKRPGYALLSNLTVGGTALGEGDSLAVYKDELLQYNNQNLYSYSSNSQRWVDKGSAVSVVTKTDQIVNNTAEQTQCDSAVNNGIGVYAWEDSRGGVRATVLDETTGVPMLTDVSLDASASRVRCVSFGSYLYVYYYKSGSLYAQRVNPQAPSAFDSAVEISSTVNTTNPTYDITVYAGIRMVFAHNVQGAAETLVGFVDEDPAVITGTLAAVTISEASTDSVAVIPMTSAQLLIAYYNSTDKLRATILNNGLTTLVSPATIDSTSTTVRNITGYISDTDEATLLYELDETNDYDHLIKQNTIDEAGSVGTATVFKRSVGLWSKAFTYTDSAGTSQKFVGVVHASDLQATYFVIRADGVIASKQLYSLASGLTSREILANVSQVGDVFSFSCLKKNKLVSETGQLFTPTGVSKTSLDFSNNQSFTAAELGGSLHIVGGVLSMYDGESVVEHGFHLYPENMSTATATSGGTLLDSTEYTAKFVYEWYDNNGKIHRSAPSLAVSQTTGAGGAGDEHTITFTVPTLRLTAKDGTTRTGVRIVGYVLVGSTYYRFTSVSATPNNDTTADTVDIVLSSVTDVTSNEILYTTGGILDNFAPPACSTIAVFKRRIFLGGLEEGGEFWYSQETRQTDPVEFNDTLKQAIEEDGGDDTAFGVLDDKLLIYKKDRFYYTFGAGPNRLGQDGSFAEPQFATNDVGCENGNSVVRMPSGLMFKSEKGIYICDSSLRVDYVGEAVEDFNDLTVTSATLDSDRNLVRFTTLTGPVLTFNYLFGNWSTDYGLTSKRAVIWSGDFVMLRTTGDVFREDSSLHTDAGGTYGLALETGWLSVAGIAGFQRVYHMQIRGDYHSQHKLQVRVGYDYSPAYESQTVIDPDSLLSISRYGDGSPYGEDSDNVYGGINSAYRFLVSMQRQKCEAIRFQLNELPSSDGTGEGLNISDIVLRVGMKQGSSKLRTAQTLGASK